MLLSRFEMWLGWGEDLTFFYNDAYIPTLGSKHPRALGRPMAQVWKEVFEDVKDRIVSVMQDGVATWDEQLLLLLERNGYPEETYHTFSYSPLMGRGGAVEGLMCVVREETDRVISERRIKQLNDLAAALLRSKSRSDVIEAVQGHFGSESRDFPFANLQLFDLPESLDPGTGDDADWPVVAIQRGGKQAVETLGGALSKLPTGPWEIPPRDALIVAIEQPGEAQAVGALVLGLNPYRLLDEATRDFANLIAAQIAGSLATIDAVSAQRRDRDRLWSLSQDLMLVCDFDGVIRLVNPSATRLLGWQEDEMVGQVLADFVHPDDLSATAKEVEKLAQGVTTLLFENRYRCQDGSYRLLDWNAVPDAGRIHAVARDITRERQLARDRERIWALSPIVKVVATTQGIINAVNPSWTNTLGWSEADTVGRNILEFVAQEQEAAQQRLAKLSESNAAVVESQSVFRAKDGSHRRFAWTTVPEAGMLYLFGRDITAETEAANALAATEEALRQSQKMEAVGQLTGGIAHDFNNLLAGVLGNLELLELRISQGRLEAIGRHLETAQGAAKRAAALTQRLLAFSRRQTLDPTAVNINRLISGLEDLIRRTVGPSIEIEVVGSGGLWMTLVDRYQLENALLNLCINARDAMPDGGRLTIETANKWLDNRMARERELPPGQYVSLCVSDTGTGMTPDVIARAFDPFFTTKPLGEGTGLGLSMIYGFVRQSGGQVRIYSEVGAGTTMCLYLPRHMGPAIEIEQELRPTQRDAGGHGETVLVIDDEASVRSLIVDVLTDGGYHVIEAADGPSGLKVLQSDLRIDLLITDVGLPGGMNGRQVADAGRVGRPKLKILFITGYAENAVIGNGLLEHDMHVITKPFGIETIVSKVREMIDEGDKLGSRSATGHSDP
ncbi:MULTISPECIES: PAS domain-containing sensor histidine kinase [unclassified Sphingobium]|uniref:hybrid sensor histidine kinase/response regulator n=1 Tax=unclassified Sphingobium TaxID=2611147 RepID=UPI000D154851|nr:PAS domain S-box protein [Sphingobium sp. JAI105]PSO10162.1 hybrid sensor histidine kinase/response regulator [Sphingobium sp. AEW4]